MKLVLQIQLLPTLEQKVDLLLVMKKFNQAATYAARVGYDAGIYGRVAIHKLTYYEIREQFNLSSVLAVRAIGKAVECYKRDKSKCPIFKPQSAICYDEHVLSFKVPSIVSIYGSSGRLLIPFICGDYWKPRLGRIKGQADLIYRQGKFYLNYVINEPEETQITPTDVLGVDLGIVNIATDSTGETSTGQKVEQVRQRYAKVRAGLNRTGTKSARRRLSKIRKRESNFRRNENHRISKSLVIKVKATDSAIALEDLKGIRDRVTVRKPDRSRHHGWSFNQLRSFVEYKALIAGIPVILVDFRNTSRTCPICGHCEKANRKSQSECKCKSCGYSANADYVGALNIRARGIAKCPIVGIGEVKAEISLSCG